jgi:hypothetical protein
MRCYAIYLKKLVVQPGWVSRWVRRHGRRGFGTTDAKLAPPLAVAWRASGRLRLGENESDGRECRVRRAHLYGSITQ